MNFFLFENREEEEEKVIAPDNKFVFSGLGENLQSTARMCVGRNFLLRRVFPMFMR